jgi:hypothetical protein
MLRWHVLQASGSVVLAIVAARAVRKARLCLLNPVIPGDISLRINLLCWSARGFLQILTAHGTCHPAGDHGQPGHSTTAIDPLLQL